MGAITETVAREIRIPAGAAALAGTLCVPETADGVVLFAHGSGSSRHSPRNEYVARELQRAGLATLLFDLLTPDEERRDLVTRAHRFDIALLARRLIETTRWFQSQRGFADFAIGYFGASTGSAAALVAAAELGRGIGAVVSRGGRPDLAGQAALARVTAATLLIVGGDDDAVIELNEDAYAELRAVKHFAIVPGASHLFEEPGALEEVSRLAAGWFVSHLMTRPG